jgi:hypothetical protein
LNTIKCAPSIRQPLPDEGRALKCEMPVAKDLKTSEKHENDDDKKNDADASRRGIAPVSTVRPSRDRAYQSQYQEDDQDCCKHRLLLPELIRSLLLRHPAPAAASFPGLFPLWGAGCLRSSPSKRQLIHKDGDCDSIPRIATVVQVIAVVRVFDIHIIVVVPVVGPVFRPWVNRTEPEATVLEPEVPANFFHGVAVDAEGVFRTKVAIVAIVGNAVPVVAAALLPGAMLGLKVMRAMLVPCTVLFAFLPSLLLLGLPLDLLRTGLLSLTLPLLCLLILGLLLLLLSSRVVLLLTLFLLLRLLSPGLLLLLFCRVVLLLTLFLLLRLLSPGLLLLLLVLLNLLLLSLLLLSCGLGLLLLLLLLSRRPGLLLLLPCWLGLLLFRLALLFLFRGLRILPLASVCGSACSEKKEQNSRADKSN